MCRTRRWEVSVTYNEAGVSSQSAKGGSMLSAKPLFHLSKLVITPGADAAIIGFYASGAPPTFLSALLKRHVAGDWGDLDDEDRASNDKAVETSERLLSAYTLPTGGKIWIITESDRSVTTVLLPEEFPAGYFV